VSVLAQWDREAKEHAERRAVQSEAEVRRLSAEVARLREELLLLARDLKPCIPARGQPYAEFVAEIVERVERIAALASLGSPQDERNPNRSNEE
jgi:uncharacterized membrane protein